MDKKSDLDLNARIEKALDTIRPYLQADGGDIALVEISEKMVVKVRLTGACETCNVSMMTLKNGVEVAIKREAPEIESVINI